MRLMLRALLAAALVCAVAPAAASASGGVQPLSPGRGATVPKGTTPAFRMRVHGPGQVWVHVCRSAARGRDGVICGREALGRARRHRGGIATWRPRRFDFPGFWANRRGTYYWQAFRIACRKGDCRQEGPVVRFRVA